MKRLIRWIMRKVFGGHEPFVVLLALLTAPVQAQEPKETKTYDGCNWTTCVGNLCSSTLAYCQPSTALEVLNPAPAPAPVQAQDDNLLD